MILGDRSVDQAEIHFGPEVKPMQRVPGNHNLWEYSMMFPGNPIKDRYEYKYGFREKGHDFTVPIFGRVGVLSKESSYCEELNERRMESGAHFDVFHFSDDKSHLADTNSKGVVFYMQWLLSFVSRDTICKTLIQIEKFHFILLSREYVEECLNFIVKCALDCTVTDIQRLYLCIVLSHLVKVDSAPLQFPNDDKNKTADACDRLLQCLSSCVNSNFLSITNLDGLKRIALILVENSNTPGWLTLAVHFYPYLGPEFVLDKTTGLNYTYDENEYKKIVGVLISHIKKVNGIDKASHRRLLLLMLKHAKNLEAAWHIFEIVEFSWFFDSEEEKIGFFVDFYQQKTEDICTKKQSVGSKLIEFYNIPKKIRGRMHKFLIQILLQFAKSDDVLNDEHAQIFLEIVISEHLNVNQLLDVFIELSKSKSDHRQDLLLDILDNEFFEDRWHDAGFAEKLQVCKTWVKTRTVNMICSGTVDDVGKIVAAYEAIDAIMQCSLNISNKILAKQLSAFVVEGILNRVDVISFIQAFSDVEKCVAVVQECYKSDVKWILLRAPKTVKKSKFFLRECSRSRYGVMILVKLIFLC